MRMRPPPAFAHLPASQRRATPLRRPSSRRSSRAAGDPRRAPASSARPRGGAPRVGAHSRTARRCTSGTTYAMPRYDAALALTATRDRRLNLAAPPMRGRRVTRARELTSARDEHRRDRGQARRLRFGSAPPTRYRALEISGKAPSRGTRPPRRGTLTFESALAPSRPLRRTSGSAFSRRIGATRIALASFTRGSSSARTSRRVA